MIAALWLACAGGSDVATGEWAVDYLPPDGRYAEYTWAGTPTDAPMMLLAEDGQWSLRNGSSWNAATELGPFEVSTTDGLWLGGTRLLPEQVSYGGVADGLAITDMGQHEVYYGSFPSTASVSVEDGDFAGEHTLAVGHGPIVLTWQGVTWELIYYED